MRLIDADALLEELKKTDRYFMVRADIENAPTVEINTNDIQYAYDQGFKSGYELGKEERPQGEWIIVKDEKWGDNVKCPFCGKELAGTDLNFCCKCGAKLIGSEKMNGDADMRKDTDND